MRRLIILATIVLFARAAAAEPKTDREQLPADPESHATSTQRVAGKVAVVGGSAVVVAAIGLAYYASTRYESAFEGPMPQCEYNAELSERPVCDVAGHARTERARRLGTIGTIAGVSGVAIALTGVVLWATSPSESSRTRIVPTASDTSAGVLVQGSF